MGSNNLQFIIRLKDALKICQSWSRSSRISTVMPLDGQRISPQRTPKQSHVLPLELWFWIPIGTWYGLLRGVSMSRKVDHWGHYPCTKGLIEFASRSFRLLSSKWRTTVSPLQCFRMHGAIPLPRAISHSKQRTIRNSVFIFSFVLIFKSGILSSWYRSSALSRLSLRSRG